MEYKRQNFPNRIMNTSSDGPNAIDSTFDVEKKLKSLDHICQALWETLIEQGVDEKILISKLHAIEKAAEETNISKSATAEACPKCNAPLQKTGSAKQKCIYCGTEITRNPFD